MTDAAAIKIRYTENFVYLPFITDLSIKFTEIYPVKAAVATPKRSGRIATVSAFATALIPDKSAAPDIIGIESRKVNSAFVFPFNLATVPPVSTVPLREIPGIIANP